ncbi:hypothetical protein CGT93_10720 [Vibrio metoecus]|nr:hypothetical protein CGT93_10720 [Vibrio metoecus]
MIFLEYIDDKLFPFSIVTVAFNSVTGCSSDIFSIAKVHFFISYFLQIHNARLRGWQRINTKLKYNNHNHRGSLGLETPRVDSPS